MITRGKRSHELFTKYIQVASCSFRGSYFLGLKYDTTKSDQAGAPIILNEHSFSNGGT